MTRQALIEQTVVALTEYDEVPSARTTGFHSPKTSGGTQDCRFCSDRNTVCKRTKYQCQACTEPLCIEPCFAEFHMM